MESTASSFLTDLYRLPCPSCGSRLSYDAEKHKISCGHCGYLEEINAENDKVVERNLAEAIQDARDYIPEADGKKVFNCCNCGAHFMVESTDVKIECGFCGSENINLEAYEHQYIQPVGIIPFYVSRKEALDAFRKWIKGGWFRPNALKRLREPESLHGIYIPFWTYDAKTESDWSGEAGHYYYVTKTRQVNGKTQTYQERRTRWTSRSGHLSHFFDDVLVIASGGLPQREVERIMPYHLDEVVNFDPRLVTGWETEIYNVEVDKGYEMASNIMDSRLRHMCSAQLGGDTQRGLRVHTEKFAQTFKHIILPLWLCSYEYRGKIFHFTINGQTGKIQGAKPTSWIKVVSLILFIIAVILIIVLLNEEGVFG